MVIILHYYCIYMLIILSESWRLRFVEHSLVRYCRNRPGYNTNSGVERHQRVRLTPPPPNKSSTAYNHWSGQERSATRDTRSIRQSSVNSCIAGHTSVDHRSGGPAVRVTIFAVFRRLSHDFADVYVYGNYFALILYLYVDYFERVVLVYIFFSNFSVWFGQRFARSCPKSDPTPDDNSGAYYIELLFFTQAPTPKFLSINTLKTNVSVEHNDSSELSTGHFSWT